MHRTSVELFMRDWVEAVGDFLSLEDPGCLTLIGVGNPVKRDDSVGLYIVERLMKVVGPRPSPRVKIHRPALNPELLLSKTDLRSTRLLVLDSVEAGMPAGTVIFANIDDTQYGFFVTHGMPLRMYPSVSENGRNVFVLGVQPHDLGVGEGLSEVVAPAADGIVRLLAKNLGVV